MPLAGFSGKIFMGIAGDCCLQENESGILASPDAPAGMSLVGQPDSSLARSALIMLPRKQSIEERTGPGVAGQRKRSSRCAGCRTPKHAAAMSGRLDLPMRTKAARARS